MQATDDSATGALTEPACRLYAVQARDGRSAVVFRRGPSKQVCLIRWSLTDDTIEVGQWFKGRIYERRSDLSPDGKLLVYFAARHRGSPATWTAVSRPPYLTALVLWEGFGAWGGGGLFESGRKLGLNHSGARCLLDPRFALPKDVVVEPVAAWAGRGEDAPIEHARLERDGWRLAQPRASIRSRRDDAAFGWFFPVPEIWERPQPIPRHARTPVVRLRRELHSIGRTGRPWRQEDFVVTGESGELRRFAACDWADWHETGDLLIATGGTLFRIPASAARRPAADPLTDARHIADLAGLTLQEKTCPLAFRRWP